MHTLKQIVHDIADHLPEDADVDEIMYRLYVLDKLNKSRKAIEHNEVITHDDLKREIEQW